MSPLPDDPLYDPERIARVVATGLLDTPPEPAFDRLTHVACRALAAPIGYASFLTHERQFLKSSGGLEDPCAPARELSLTHTYCAEVVRTGRPVVISDARGLAPWRDHPAVTELGLVAYMGVPLKSNGHVLGTLCVLDRVGREWRPGDVVLLEEVAAALQHELDHRRERAQLRAALAQEQRLASFAQRAIEGTPRMQELLLDAVGGVASGLGVDRCAVVELAPGGALVVTAAMGQGVSPGAIQPSAALRSALAQCLSQPRRKPLSIDQTHGPLLIDQPRAGADVLAPEAFASAALASVGTGKPWAALVALSRTPRAFAGAELELMSAFARLLGGASRRVQADDQLRAAERGIRSVLDAVSEGVCRLDPGGRLTFANAAAVQLLGFREADELVGREFESLMRAPPVGALARASWVRAALAEGRPGHVQRETLRRADGSTLVAECRAVPLRGERKVEGAVVTFSDVTERVQNETERAALLEAQRRAVEDAERASAELTALLGAAPIGIGLVDDELRYRRLNHALAELNGVPADEHVGRRVRDMIGGVEGERVEEALRRVIATGEPISGVEVKHAVPGHPREVRTVVGSAYPVAVEGRVQAIGIACFEVSELKRHEEEQRLLSEVSSLLASFDFEPNLRKVAALLVPRLAEVCLVRLVERDGSLHLAAEARAGPEPAGQDPSRDALLLALADEAARGRTILVSPSLEGEDAELVTPLEPARAQALALVDVRAILLVPLVRGDDPAAGVLTLWSGAQGPRNTDVGLRLAREVVRRMLLALERTRLFAEAQEATRSREDVLAVVSHDLRNPLTTILMAAARLSDLLDDAHDAPVLRPLVLIERAARTMKRLIDDLLDFAAIEAKRLRVDTKPEEVARLVHEVVSSFQQVADAGRVTLVTDVARALPRIQADRERIEQVLSNIVGNALKVTPPGGRVAVGARLAGAFVQFSVADTGPGIPRDQLQVIFERYRRGERTGYQGVGLGLAIAKGIVEAHRGAIRVESAPGAGATFHFTVPAELGP